MRNMEQIYNLVISDRADEDLAKIMRSNSTKFSEGLFLRYENIKLMPKLYQRIYYEKKSNTDYRRIVYKKYIVIYKIHKNEITILRIISQKENYLESNYLKSL